MILPKNIRFYKIFCYSIIPILNNDFTNDKNKIHKTKVREIHWYVGQTCAIYPNIKIEPIFINNIKIDKILAYNAKFIQDNGINTNAIIGATINEHDRAIISEVYTQVEVKLPSICPECGSKLAWNNDDLICNNIKCNNLTNMRNRRIFNGYEHTNSNNDLMIDNQVHMHNKKFNNNKIINIIMFALILIIICLAIISNILTK